MKNKFSVFYALMDEEGYYLEEYSFKNNSPKSSSTFGSTPTFWHKRAWDIYVKPYYKRFGGKKIRIKIKVK